MTTTASRTVRLLTAAAITTTLLPAAGALAQPATPTPSTTATPAPGPTRLQTTVSARTTDVGSTVALDVRGTPGQVVDLLASTARSGARIIRTTTLTPVDVPAGRCDRARPPPWSSGPAAPASRTRADRSRSRSVGR